MTTLQRLREIDPSHRYYMGALTGRVFCEVDDMAIHDPYVSENGFESVAPCEYYGIPTKAALVMFEHNMELPEFEGETEDYTEIDP